MSSLPPRIAILRSPNLSPFFSYSSPSSWTNAGRSSSESIKEVQVGAPQPPKKKVATKGKGKGQTTGGGE